MRKNISDSQSASRRFKVLIILAAATLLTMLGFSQQYSIDWFKIAGGGGTSTNGPYALSGTAGQPDAGHMTGGNYTLDAGFWGIIAAVQTPGAPALTVTLSGNNVIISWPSPSTGFVLQENSGVNNAAGWGTFSGPVNDNGTTRSVTISPPIGNEFFRLKK
jgi:hypothetical protein